MSNRPQSQHVFDEMCQIIPGGVNSPVRSCKSMGQSPLIVERASGACVVDVDGNSYIDFCGSWGALIHGHAHPTIVQAVQKRMEKGSSFGITTSIEGELAKEIIRLVKSIDKIRFVNSGTEATMTVARLARGFTKRDTLVKFSGNYHGHADFFLVQAGSGLLEVSPTASSAGVPEDVVKHTLCLPYNDCEAVKKLFAHPDYRDRIAAVILEPVAGNMGVVPAEQAFMQLLRDETSQAGSLLIFDEVITGFRVAQGGAQELYPVRPDLFCFGKIIGAGFPVAAFGGRRAIMDCLAPLGAVYQAGTLSGNPVAMEAGLQSLRLLQRPHFYAELQRKTSLLLDPLQARIQERGWNACIQRVGSMFTLFFGRKQVKNVKEALEVSVDIYARLFRTLFSQGIYIPPSAHEAWFISDAHEEDQLVKTREAILNFMNKEFK